MLILILAPLYAFVAIAVAAVPGALSFVILRRVRDKNRRRLILISSILGLVLLPLLGINIWIYTLGFTWWAETFLVSPPLLGLIFGWLGGMFWNAFHARRETNNGPLTQQQKTGDFWSRPP